MDKGKVRTGRKGEYIFFPCSTATVYVAEKCENFARRSPAAPHAQQPTDLEELVDLRQELRVDGESTPHVRSGSWVAPYANAHGRNPASQGRG